MAKTVNIVSRLQELYLYDLYGFNLELKPLSMTLNIDEELNCVLTGVYEGRRRMLAVTNYRIIIIASSVLSKTEIDVIKRKAVQSFDVHKKLFNNSVEFTAENKKYSFVNVNGRVLDLFKWAMEKEIKTFDE